ncbi:STAS/SEC14 domain-containing protein [Dyella acidiphila]|uniref:STAS/SEC14 domain-containing protein n=1 Tax=Dyella acidiphila TaxID=2775866 RepID=A0ABR9GFS7_9GAMM|nr:STAS/SEC14 domain-containing protein [Dyella acidiphila]MBE1162819.1 STAS/SEC14 domain-containing protein [Dyella acidiphila]
MIEQLPNLPAGILGFRMRGTVTADDYESVMVPDIEAAFALNRKVRSIIIVGEDFVGFAPGAMWDDMKLGFRHISGWERTALVTDVGWMRVMSNVFGFAMPSHFKLFSNAQMDEAVRWITEP